MAKRDYAVGRGKPPVRSQFKKGQSGNPGGKPGSTKNFQQRWRVSFEEALEMTYSDLEDTDAKTVLDDVTKEIVLSAARGNPQAVKTLLALTEKYSKPDLQTASNEKTSAPEHTIAGGSAAGETQGVTLSQGKSQGNFEDEPSVEAISQPDQQVDAPAEQSSGNASGTDTPPTDEPDVAATRPKRPTITIAGEIVQRGD
jgi:hypothetical protein